MSPHFHCVGQAAIEREGASVCAGTSARVHLACQLATDVARLRATILTICANGIARSLLYAASHGPIYPPDCWDASVNSALEESWEAAPDVVGDVVP